MSSHREHTESPEPASNQPADRRRDILQKLGRYRFEILLELSLVVVCAVVGVTFQFKLLLTLSLFCFAAAVPDWVTGYLIRRQDTDRAHGNTLLCFFIASGLMRTAKLGLTLMLGSIMLMVFFPGRINLVDIGGVAGLIVTHVVSVLIFPVTLVGVMFGLRIDGGVFFCRDLTKARRIVTGPGQHSENPNAGTKQGPTGNLPFHRMSPAQSLRQLALASAISLAIFTITVVFTILLLTDNRRTSDLRTLVAVGTMVSQLIFPVLWYMFFCGWFVEPWARLENFLANEPAGDDEIHYVDGTLMDQGSIPVHGLHDRENLSKNR